MVTTGIEHSPVYGQGTRLEYREESTVIGEGEAFWGH